MRMPCWLTVLGVTLFAATCGAEESLEPEPPLPVTRDLKALSAPPKVTPLPETKEPGVQGLFYDGLPFKGKPTRVFAWLGLPKDAKGRKVPGMVLVHGGGGTAHARWVRLWTERGYAAISMDLCGKAHGATEGKPAPHEFSGPDGWDASFEQTGWPVADQWQYHAVADAVLANSLLRSRPCWAAKLKHMGPEKSGKWLAAWDPSHYLPKAKRPMLWVAGDRDFAYPLGSLQKSYLLPKGDRYLSIRPAMPHGHPQGEAPAEIGAFAEQVMAGGVPLARGAGQGLGGRKAWAVFQAKAPLVKAQCVFTKDAGPWQKRKWDVADAPLDAATGKVAFDLPDGVTVFYFTVTDQRNLVASSEHVTRGNP
ncbi:MAG: dipeptidyl aminopeptidase [Planctomycetota bacterium]|nr:dipeptidyl aminopeptidase [Planctomycetota bacterium]